MKSLFSSLIFTVFLTSTTFAQPAHFAIHISNPLSMFYKAGIKLEYRFMQVGVLATGIQHYARRFPQYPGSQLGLELRYYFPNSEKTHEWYVYGKGYAGYQQHKNSYNGEVFDFKEVPSGNYYGFGAGAGRHFNFNNFFLDLNLGVKYTDSEVKQRDAFYIVGPACLLDFHFNLGFQF